MFVIVVWIVCVLCLLFFFFKQKTAYEMRISDWSSDVCSSDLAFTRPRKKATLADLASVLGRVGEEGGMTAGVAKRLFDKREEIERVFLEHDAMLASQPAGSVKAPAKPNGAAAR